MKTLAYKRIVVGVTGGIAAYKTPDLVRRLRDAGAEIRVVMTPGATGFITPLTLQAVSANPVHDTLIDADAEAGMGHIELARWADAIVIAPTTADFMARLASGMANDLLSTICLAATAPIWLAPAMNHQMWAHTATQRNLAQLIKDGCKIIGPGSGDQACGETGAGRMSESLEIVAALSADAATRALDGRHVMITAGPTFESIDPVRGITNHSSGKMGFAIAEAAAKAGASVTLIAGPCALETPAGVQARINVRSALDMHNAVHERISDVDVFVGVAAVADYRPVDVADQKIKKNADTMTINLVRNPDIIASVAALEHKPYMVGFAAETNDVLANARRKLVGKGLDMVCANRVGAAAGGFGSDENALALIERAGVTDLPMGPKSRLAGDLIDIIAARLNERTQHDQPAHDSSAQDSR